MSRTAIATWLSLPIIWTSYRQHMHVAYGLLGPVACDGSAHRARHRLGDRIGIAPLRSGPGLNGAHHRLVRDLRHPLAVGADLRDSGQRDVGVGRELAAVGDGERNRHD